MFQSELGIDNIPAEDEKKYKDGIEVRIGRRKWVMLIPVGFLLQLLRGQEVERHRQEDWQQSLLQGGNCRVAVFSYASLLLYLLSVPYCMQEGVSRDCTLLLQEIEEEKEKVSTLQQTLTNLACRLVRRPTPPPALSCPAKAQPVAAAVAAAAAAPTLTSSSPTTHWPSTNQALRNPSPPPPWP